LRFVNDPHPAAAELAGDAVMRDGLPDHGWSIRLLDLDKCFGKFILGGMRKAVKRKNSDPCPVVGDQCRAECEESDLATDH
jgi:hypothetical protein